MYIPEINSKIKINGRKDDIRCANNYMNIVLGFLSSHCHQSHFNVPIFHTKIPQTKIHPVISHGGPHGLS